MNQDPENAITRSVIVITIEGLGARWLEPWGCGSVRTLAINRLAAEGLLIENAHAIHGNATRQWNQWMQPACDVDSNWLSTLRDSGRTTVLLTDSSAIASASEPHFQEVVELQQSRASVAASELASTHFVNFFAGAAELVQTLPEQGTLLWIHSKGFHLPWDAPQDMRLAVKGDEDPEPPHEVGPPQFSTEPDGPDASDLITGWQQSLAAQIHVLDAALAIFFDSVLDPVTCSNLPLVCLTSTGGYGMGEHSRIGPNEPGLFHEEYVHVPLLCSFPNSDLGNFRLSELMAADRLSGIVESWMAGKPVEQILDLSIFPDRSRQIIYSRTTSSQMIRTATWKLLQTGDDRKLFLKPDDRWDQNDVANLCRDIADELSVLLEQLPDSTGDTLASSQPPLVKLLTDRMA